MASDADMKTHSFHFHQPHVRVTAIMTLALAVFVLAVVAMGALIVAALNYDDWDAIVEPLPTALVMGPLCWWQARAAWRTLTGPDYTERYLVGPDGIAFTRAFDGTIAWNGIERLTYHGVAVNTYLGSQPLLWPMSQRRGAAIGVRIKRTADVRSLPWIERVAARTGFRTPGVAISAAVEEGEEALIRSIERFRSIER